MRNIIHCTKLITILLILISCCFYSAFQQSPQKLSLLPQAEQKTIQFKEDKSSSPSIQNKQIHYSYNPEIQDEYSIVNTLIYPQTGGGKFISSLPKDNFVTKLINKNQNPSQTQTQTSTKIQTQTQTQKDQSSIPSKQNLDQQKQVEKRAQDILKKQTIQQDAKLAQQQKSEDKPSKDQKKTPTTPAKPDQIKPQPSTQNPEKTSEKTPQQKAQKSEQKQQKPEKSEEKPKEWDQKPEKSQKLITSVENKKQPEIEKSETNIKFKQHEIAKPLSITNYPFEKKTQSKQTEKRIEEVKTAPPQQKKAQQNQKQNIPQPEPPKKKDSQNKVPQQKIVIEEKPKQQATSKPVIPQQPKKQKPSQLDLDPQMIAEFNRITKSLSVDPSQIKNSLRFESLVKQQIQESDWKLLTVKILIWTAILIAIYQATCSSESQEKKIEKGKYSPVGISQLQTENSLQMAERADQK